MSALPASSSASTPVGRLRFRVFVDFWNLQLTLNDREAATTGRKPSGFLIDWCRLPDCLVQEAAKLLRVTDFSYEGSKVFTSYNPKSPQDRKYRSWLANWLERQPGIQVLCFERRPKSEFKCPTCHRAIAKCPHAECSAPIAATTERGVDTAIATEMIRLAWERAYDVAILVSSDADLVPAVEFLDQGGFRIIQAGFPPYGAELSRACWATIDIFKLRAGFRRT